METEQKQPIEYEEVKLKVPKPIIEWLKRMQPLTRMTPTEKLEYEIVDFIRAELESRSMDEMVPCLDPSLAQVFLDVLGDKRYAL